MPWYFNRNNGICFRPFCHAFIYESIDDYTLYHIDPLRVYIDCFPRRRATTSVITLMPNVRRVIVTSLPCLLMAVSSSVMRELQSINQHFLSIPKLIKASEVKVYGLSKNLFHQTSLTPIEIYNDFSHRGSPTFFKVYAMLVATFFKNYSHRNEVICIFQLIPQDRHDAQCLSLEFSIPLCSDITCKIQWKHILRNPHLDHI